MQGELGGSGFDDHICPTRSRDLLFPSRQSVRFLVMLFGRGRMRPITKPPLRMLILSRHVFDQTVIRYRVRVCLHKGNS